MYASYNDKSATHKATAKYILPYVIGIFLLLMVGQIAGTFFTAKQLNKVSGKVVDLQTQIIGQIRHRGIVSTYTPDYALTITLDNGTAYYMQDADSTRQKLSTLLHSGDDVTIYTPTMLLKILNAGFVHDVSQVELGNQIVYNFDDQKKGNWVLAGICAVAAGIFFALRRSWLKGDW
jgi:hypothetical protein